MELLNIVAQIVVVIGALIWVIIKFIWGGLFFVWELIWVYGPVVLNKAKRLSVSGLRFSRKIIRFVLEILGYIGRTFKQDVFSRVNVSEVAQSISVKVLRNGQFVKNSGLSPQFPQVTKLGSKVVSKLSLAGMVVSFVILVFIFFPDLVFAVIPYQTEPIESAVDESALGGKFTDGNLYSAIELPEKNQYLPDGNWLVIPKIGVLTQINESSTDDHEDALKKGVWRVPEFADPTQGASFPTILVAHKFGYLVWSNDFRKKNSFYNLEDLKVGDTFDVIWDHRRFTYEIYAGEEGKDITDYKADVVLYTCKYLNSPARIFRYARRVEY